MRNVGFMKMNRKGEFILAAVALVAVATMITFTVRANNDDDVTKFRARLTDFGEVPPQLTGGTGTFHATLNEAGTRIDWTLTYTGLTGGVQVAHIHFGPPQNVGTPVVFFCNNGAGGSRNGGTVTSGPTYACPDDGAPAHAGTVTGFWTAADVLAVPGQNVTAGNFAGLVRILRGGLGYANVHTVAHPGGEIRGQVRVRHEEDEN